MPRLQDLYTKELRPGLMKDFGCANIFQVPRLEKIVLNMGVGSKNQEDKKVIHACEALRFIAGQDPVVTKARKSIAGFKLREGMSIGAKVTLRKARMYEFLDRLLTIAMPRIKDFRGLSLKSFDGCGNYAFGIREHLVFPEINQDKVDQVMGLDIVIVTTASSNSQAFFLLKSLGFPFPHNQTLYK